MAHTIHEPTALNCQPGRWLIDTQHGHTIGRIHTPIQAAPLLAQRQAERSGDCTAEFAPFRQEMEAILARQRAAKATQTLATDVPQPTAPIDTDIPATLRDTLQVVGASIIGVVILAGLISSAASRAWGG